jgi:transcription initiation factor TFIID TATA-box-binding protein
MRPRNRKDSKELTANENPPDIVNVVASSRIEGRFKLDLLSIRLGSVDFEPEIFPGLIYRRIAPKATMILFNKGKISSIGTRSEREGRDAIMRTVDEASELGCIDGNPSVGSIDIVNVVGTLDLGTEIDLDSLLEVAPHYFHKSRGFPGLLFRHGRSAVTAKVFSSGKVVLSGARSEYQAGKILGRIRSLTESSRKRLRSN